MSYVFQHRLPRERRKTNRPPPAPSGSTNLFSVGMARVTLYLREIELRTHRQVLSDCELLLRTTRLTLEQSKAVSAEINWRRAEVCRITEAIRSARAVLRRRRIKENV